VKAFIRFTWFLFLFGLVVIPAHASFTSLYIFGDGVSTTTTNPVASTLGSYYYGLRRSNGRVWVELLAQQLNLTNNFWYSNHIANQLSYTNLSAYSTNWSYSSNNWSYYGDASTNLIANLNAFVAPPNASNALFIIWVSDADFVNDMANIYTANIQTSARTNITQWTNAINQSLTNHWQAITNLYFAKGVRTLVMPNAVDITEIPAYNTITYSADKSFIRQMVINFNVAFTPLLSNAMALCPGLTIHEPDFFSVLDNLLANPAAYGLTNALQNGQPIDALDDNSLTDLSLNGPGTNYIFWDATDPTAKVHAIIAGVAQQVIAPVQISQITSQNGTNRLNLANVPVGLSGIVLGSTNLAMTNWTTVTDINSTNSLQPVFVPASGPMQFYRLNFPFSWTWP
jgi:phospholipase/lecithinase/hemolysin